MLPYPWGINLRDNARHPICWKIITTRWSKPKKWNEVQRKGLCNGKKKPNPKIERRIPVARCQVQLEEIWGRGEKVPRHCRTSFNRGICLQHCELPGPKWRPPDGEIPETDIEVHTRRIQGEAETNLNQLFGTNPARSLWEILIC